MNQQKKFKFLEKDYDLPKLLDYIDKEGYKISKKQKGGLEFMIDKRGLSKIRKYFKSNGDLVLVPTLRFEGQNKGLGDYEQEGLRGVINKTELKPKIKKTFTPEEKKEFDKTRFLFFYNEVETNEKKVRELEKKLYSKDVVVDSPEYVSTSKIVKELRDKIKRDEKIYMKILKDYTDDEIKAMNDYFLGKKTLNQIFKK
jgi:signal recognition particle GTPase